MAWAVCSLNLDYIFSQVCCGKFANLLADKVGHIHVELDSTRTMQQHLVKIC